MRLSNTYGLTDEQLGAYQAGVICHLCQSRKATEVDHCHETGKTRGFLCRNCNVGLGYFKDDPEHLARAIHYLQRGDTTRMREIQTQLGLAA